MDNKLLVCIKPAGLLSTDEPGGLPELLRAEPGVGQNLFTVHRLDAAVGGVMLLARTRHAASTLGQALQRGEFRKEYLAVTHGALPEEGTLRDFLVRDRVRRITEVSAPDDPQAREALLDYRCLGRTDGLSLVRIRLHTGRTHQIRCQFSHRGWPLWGDKKYGRGEEGGIALWSASLAFPHPVTGERLYFEKEPPRVLPWTEFEDKLWKE